MSNRVDPRRDAIEEAIRSVIMSNHVHRPLKKMPLDPEFHLDGASQARIAGISESRKFTSKTAEARADVVVIAPSRGNQRNGISIRQFIDRIRATRVCVILDGDTVTLARVHIEGRIVKVHPAGKPITFISLITDR